jgi:2-polyprenyl-3-methyl-5-hydroxy-6-metoxy-1,4-benzoquinol methylase
MKQRFAFDQIANVYRVARPDYPEALIEDVVSYADLKQSDWILEVGCGTGQATKSFAKRGFPIVAMDPGPEMLRGAREDWASAMLSFWRRRSRHGPRTVEPFD